MRPLRHAINQFLSFFTLTFCIFILSGCSVQLYSGLTEIEANEMMHVLAQHGISSEKVAGQEQTFTLMVDSHLVGSALKIFQEYGYPKQKFKNMGDIFKREGMVSSPMEERVRFVYALSQEIGETLSHIDGVIVARVHIVLPENNPLHEKQSPSAASVFIKHRPDMDIALLIPRIKSLVANSIEGLTYDRVAVVLVDAQVLGDAVHVPPASRLWLWITVGGGALVLGIVLGCGIGVRVAWYRVTRRGEGAASEGV